jgi:uncharacterized protein (DUF305 family)
MGYGDQQFIVMMIPHRDGAMFIADFSVIIPRRKPAL